MKFSLLLLEVLLNQNFNYLETTFFSLDWADAETQTQINMPDSFNSKVGIFKAFLANHEVKISVWSLDPAGSFISVFRNVLTVLDCKSFYFLSQQFSYVHPYMWSCSIMGAPGCFFIFCWCITLGILILFSLSRIFFKSIFTALSFFSLSSSVSSPLYLPFSPLIFFLIYCSLQLSSSFIKVKTNWQSRLWNKE